MNVLYERCAGLDVHKETVVACRRVMSGAQVVREVRSFSTTTRGLLALADWLREAGCTHVAMEATGVYWKPVWHVLEGSSSWCWPMRRTLRTSLDARATSTTLPG